MTRRKVIFVDSDYSKYATPEFNGDKSELLAFNSSDSCDKDWKEIEELFMKCQTLHEFEMANEYVQNLYHSCFGPTEIVLVERVVINDYIANDDTTIFVYAPSIDVGKNAEFKDMMRYYCRQEINKGNCGEYDCEFCPVDAAFSRIFKSSDNCIEEEEY